MQTFDFASGDLSLDFANTANWHASEKPEEMLKQVADLIDWGEAAGLLTPDIAAKLRDMEQEEPEKANRAFRSALQLREALYHIFRNHYSGESIPADDLACLNAWIREAMEHIQLTPKDGEIQWAWTSDISGIHLILLPVARAAAELLTSDKASRVRECEDDRGCGYLFIDQSKNHSRRWCSMESCGNRAKARRHQKKVQAKGL
jgi:predicted RNA-binding Zn ribbon-like protein